MTHRTASFTRKGRLKLAKLVVDDGWSHQRAAERFHVSPGTARKWADRYRAGETMEDHSSRPHRSPTRTAPEIEQRFLTYVNPTSGDRIGLATSSDFTGRPSVVCLNVMACHSSSISTG